MNKDVLSRQQLLQELNKVAVLANGNKWSRLAKDPIRYLQTAWFNKKVYPKKQQAKVVTATTFYGSHFYLGLPAGTDIYLTGGKTHPSEIRLSRFMIRHFKPEDTYVDVGGHYGFFAGLAQQLLAAKKVIVFEPAPDTFRYLSRNLADTEVRLQQKGLADETGQLTFYQFPALYSEFNSLDVAQYQQEDWFKNYPPQAVEVPISTLDEQLSAAPDWLKIDVEGAEDRVVIGGQKILAEGKTVISMEYLPAALSNGSHAKARKQLEAMGYKTFYLNDNGLPQACPDPEAFLKSNDLDSANLIFATTLPTAII